MRHPKLLQAVAVALFVVAFGTVHAAEPIDLTRAVIVVRPGALPAAEQAAGRVLREELQKRTGAALDVSSAWPERGVAIAWLIANRD